MEDNEVARIFVSTIIGEEVLELRTVSQELTTEQVTIPQPKGKVQPETEAQPQPEAQSEAQPQPEAQPETEAQPKKDKIPEATVALCRLDFVARIKTVAEVNGEKIIGEKKVAIELQKAKEFTDLIRFRRYLGLLYTGQEESADERTPPQIYCIYLLGYDVALPKCPILRIDPEVKDASNGTTLTVNNAFINALVHRSWIVQIRLLKSAYSTKMEQLLALFDQKNCTKNSHILNVNEENFREDFQPLIHRLQTAQSTQDIRRIMQLEDEVIKEFRIWEHKVEEQAKALRKKDKALNAQAKALSEKDKALDEKDKALSEQERMIAEQAKRIAELERKYGK
jgi:hypothetical protein